MTNPAGDLPDTVCPYCTTPYAYGETGVNPGGEVQQAEGGRELVAPGVAYCPNPGCPGQSGDI